MDTGQSEKLAYRPDDYPTHISQAVVGRTDSQKMATIWGDVTSWPMGTYTIFYEGEGTLTLGGNVKSITVISSRRITFQLAPPTGWDPVVELVIQTSDISDPVRNILVIMPGYLNTYQEKPFNPLWLEGLRIFKSLRFMDWGETNSWNFHKRDSLPAGKVFSWADSAQIDHYTWAGGRGVPNEMMIKLMNEEGFDGWVCTPDRVDQEFMIKMATLFRDTLDPNLHLSVEFSNEIWTTMMDQTQYLKNYGKPSQYVLDKYSSGAPGYNSIPAITWPENITGPLEDCLRMWTEVYGSQLDRITRIIGLQAAWQDLSKRMAFNGEARLPWM